MPEFVGKMQFYLTALDTLVRQKNENPSIGVATYEITKTLPKELQDQLPSTQEIARLLEGIEGK